jgi:HEAT repeat protein
VRAVLPEIEPLLSDPDATVRFSALQVLVRLRGQAWPSVWYVKERLSDSDPAIRADAAYVIGMAGPCGVEAVPQLADALGDSHPYVRYRAAVALQRMDRGGAAAIPALERASRCDRDPRVREAAACAIHRIEKATCGRPDD